MDLIMCPNGHPNRPGRSQCVVCRAPLPMPSTAETQPVEATTSAPQAPAPAPETTSAATNSTNSGCGRWAVLLALGLVAVGLVLASLFWPIRVANEEQAAPIEPTMIEPAAVVAATQPTLQPAPTSQLEPTAVPTAIPDPTTAPTVVLTEAPPEPTAPAAADEGSELLDHGNLIINGDFSERWVDSWLREVSANNGVQAAEVVAFENAPSDFGLRLTKTGTGTTRMQQKVDVPRRATEMHFVGDVRLVGSLADDGQSEGRVALMLTYTDENDESLGYSVWMDDSQPASDLWGISPLPEFGPHLSPRYVEGDGWHTIDVRLQEEFINRLPGLNSEQVKHVYIDLLALASDTCEPAACPVTLEVANLQFLPTEME